jgi:hypothetical protein
MSVIDRYLSVLRDGGLLILEEAMGLNTVDCFPERSMPFDVYYQLIEKQYALKRSDSSIGRYLPRMLENKGMVITHLNFSHPILKTPRQKSLLRLNLESQIPFLKEGSLITSEEAKYVCCLLLQLEENNDLYISYFESLQVTARKI